MQHFIHVPCGSCVACLSRRSMSWVFRLSNETKHAEDACFVTLTYDDKKLGYEASEVSKRDIQLFIKKLRQKIDFKTIKYFLVSEYGPKTDRPHYHAIFWNLGINNRKYIDECWNLGFVTVDNVTNRRIHYVTKYFMKLNSINPDKEKVFILASKGLGIKYMANERMHKENLDFSVLYKGKKMPMPRYYSDKIFNKGEKLVHQKKLKNEYDKRSLELINEKGIQFFKDELETKEKRIRNYKKTNEKL